MSVTTWRYSLPRTKECGWAVVFVDSAGCLAILSDVGNATHRWNVGGVAEKDFREFLLKCDDGYLTDKLGYGRSKEYDPEGTLESVNRFLAQHLAPFVDDRNRAAEEKASIAEDFGNLGDDLDFSRWALAFADEGLLGVDPYELRRTRTAREVRAVVSRVLPALREAIRADLAKDS